jgi:hypothetical protein
VVDVNLQDRQRGGLITTQFLSWAGTPTSWDNLTVSGPNGAASINAPALSNSGQFSWQTDPTDVLGTYHFDVRATNVTGSDTGRLTVNLVPEVPPVVVDRDLGWTTPGSSTSARLMTSQGSDPITWGSLVFTTPNGSSPVNAPMLSPSGLLSWRSSTSDVLGTYHFDVTATNIAGSDVGRFTIELMPLPVSPTIVDANLGNTQKGTLIAHQFTVSEGSPPIIWSDLVMIGPGGSSPASAPRISETGELRWQTTDTDAVGTYHFEVTAANLIRTDLGYLIVDVLAQQPTPGAPVVVDRHLAVDEARQLIAHQFMTSAGATPAMWNALVAIGPDGHTPVNAPTLSESGQFTWQADEADVPGIYYFDVVATNDIGSDFGHLIVDLPPAYVLIPEPATWLLLAAGGLVVLRTRWARTYAPSPINALRR